MYRIISFIVIFSCVAVLLYFHQQNSHVAGGKHMDKHETNEIPEGHRVPAVDGKVMEDPSGSLLLEVETENFTFMPKKAGVDEKSVNEGHAHIYVNGEKKGRLYGRYYDLGELEPGKWQIKVTLNSHNHGTLSHKGEEISFVEEIEVK